MIIPLFSAIAFLFGVFLETMMAFPLLPLLAWSAFFLILRRKFEFFLILSLATGVFQTQHFEANEPENLSHGEFLELSGIIVEEVDRRLESQKITVLTEHGRVLVSLSPYEKLNYGDEVLLKGILDSPSADIEGFNYANYLARYRVWSVMYNPYVELVARAPPSFRGGLYELKLVMEKRLNRLYFEPEASFAAGLLLGSRKGMPPELADAFQAVGLTHIVAISGYNISLVIALMFLMLSFLSLRWRVIVSTVAIIVFVILVGASAAVVRAGIMGTLALWGLYSGRKSQAFFGLLWSGVIMVMWNPYTLVYDVGFQLSFASTLGLLVFNPILDQFFPKWEGGAVLREAFLLTLAAQIMTLPLIMFHFGRLSLLSLLANILAAPFLPFAMLFSGLSLVFGKPLAIVAWFHLRMVELTAIWLAKIPFADVSAPLSVFSFVGLYLLLMLFLGAFYKPTLARAFGLLSLGASLRAPKLECEKRERQ